LNIFQDLIGNLCEEKAKELLIAAAEKNPGLIFDISESIETDNSSPEPRPNTQPDWCKCMHCREMPTDEEKLCCMSLRSVCI